MEMLASEAVTRGTDILVSVGGDGSINETFKAVKGSTSVLAIIPTGSGNGLARHLKIPLDPASAIALINQGKTKNIDTAEINGIPFASIAGTGFDAFIAKLFSRSKKRGFFTYFWLCLSKYFNYQSKTYQLKTDSNEVLNEEAFFISFANSDQFGYNTSIAPDARIDDGLLNICLVKKPRIYQLPWLAYLVYTKQIQKSNLYKTFTAQNLNVKTNENMLVNIDGEAILMKSSLKIKTLPASLEVIVP